MRSEIIRCDTCTKERNAEYVLPKEWVTTEQTDRYDGENMTHHFCSKTCLIKWASIGIATCDVEIMVDAIRTNGTLTGKEREQNHGWKN